MKTVPFGSLIRPTDEAYGFEMDEYWLWCGSAVEGEDGRWHMFSARWPKTLPFFNGYVTASEIVHASSDGPYGPYRFEDVVLPDRGESYWDGRMTHNPSVVKHGDTYAIYYIGSHYHGRRPDFEALTQTQCAAVGECYGNIRIGVATSRSVYGPWERRDHPVFEPAERGWDSTIVTNPAPCVLDDGSVYLFYRSNTPSGMKIGVAKAPSFSDRFTRVVDHPLFQKFDGMVIEDVFVWSNGDHFEMIAKDCNGKLCGEKWGGVHFVSRDGIRWDAADPITAYSRTVRFRDGRSVEAYHLERPNVTFKNGAPYFISFAYGVGGGTTYAYGNKNFDAMTRSKTLIVPLSHDT